MYRKRASIVTFNYLRQLTKVYISPPNSSLHFRTVLQRPDFLYRTSETSSENNANSFQQNEFVNVNLGRNEEKGNGVYGQNQNGSFGLEYIENSEKNEFLRNPDAKNRGLGRSEQIGDRVYGQNPRNQNGNFRPEYRGTGEKNEFSRNPDGKNGILGRSEQIGDRGYGQNPTNQFRHNQNGSFVPDYIENGVKNHFLGNPEAKNGILGRIEQIRNRVYGQNPSNQFKHNQNGNFVPDYIENGEKNNFLGNPDAKNRGLGRSEQIGSRVHGQNPSNQFQHHQNHSFGRECIEGGPKNEFLVNADAKNGILGGSEFQFQHNPNPNDAEKNEFVGNPNAKNDGLSAGYAGYTDVRPGNGQQSWNTVYNGEKNMYSQQGVNGDHSSGSSGNYQNSWGVGYSNGSNGHPSRIWNEHHNQNAGMHRGTCHDNYARNSGISEFPQGNYNAGNPGIYHGNTGFSNNHGDVREYQQTTGGGHQSGVGFVQHIPDQYTLAQSSVKSNEEPEVVEDDQLKGTMEELDKFCQERKLKEAIDVLGLLEGKHIPVDLSHYLLLFKECGEEKALEEGKSIHKHLLRSGLHLEVKTYNKILEMYCSCGSLDDVFEVFDKMPMRNLTTWDTMISWLAKNGHGEDALLLFTKFKETGLNPDERMFLGVFSACGVLGDTVEGLLHFESMKKDYSVVPSMEHYISVVDMLGTAGNLDEALEFIEKMPVEPSVEVWEVLMNLCRMHGNLELGDRCAELVEVLDPSRLDDQSRAGYLPLKPSDLAKDNGKNKSWSTFPEGRNRVHEYRAGDRSQPELNELLRGMRHQLKEAGYTPEVRFVLHDIDQEGKEEALMGHSERLAVSQGLMTSPARNPIRIIKNLRFCVDCHNVMKLVSKLVGRVLIIRDAKRFHHFENGSCSCRDYW